MPKVQTIRVFPNPFVHVDVEGRPAGHVQREPNIRGGDPHLQWVGCKVVSAHVRKATENPEHQIRGLQDFAWWGDAHDHYWEYDTEPTEVALTAYYMRLVQHHDLFPADRESHALVFGSPEGFIDPKRRLRQLSDERSKDGPCIPFLRAPANFDPTAKRDLAAEWDAFAPPPPAPKAPAKTSAPVSAPTAKSEN
jgi:hypothetical protein